MLFHHSDVVRTMVYSILDSLDHVYTVQNCTISNDRAAKFLTIFLQPNIAVVVVYCGRNGAASCE